MLVFVERRRPRLREKLLCGTAAVPYKPWLAW